MNEKHKIIAFFIMIDVALLGCSSAVEEASKGGTDKTNNAPIASNILMETSENSTLVITNTDILHSVTDEDSNNVSILTLPNQSKRGFSITEVENGIYQYVPESHFSGTDSVEYVASDGENESMAKIDITILPKNWEIIETIKSKSAIRLVPRHIDMNILDEIMTVWSEMNSDRFSSYHSNGKWGAAFNILTADLPISFTGLVLPGSGNSIYVNNKNAIEADGSTSKYLLSIKFDIDSYRIDPALYPWSSPELRAPNTNFTGFEKFVINKNDVGFLVWTQLNNTDFSWSLMASRFSNGIFEAEKEISNASSQDAYSNLRVFPNGDALIRWCKNGLWINRYIKSSWEGRKQISPDCLDVIDSNSNGHILLFWWSGVNYDVYKYATYNASTQSMSVDKEFIAPGFTENTFTRNYPSGNINKNGTGVLMYHKTDFEKVGVFDTKVIDRQMWSAKIAFVNEEYDLSAPERVDNSKINPDPTNSNTSDFNSSGNGVLVWSQKSKSSLLYEVWASRYYAATGWNVAQKISENAVPMSHSVDISTSINENNKIVIVWGTLPNSNEYSLMSSQFIP